MCRGWQALDQPTVVLAQAATYSTSDERECASNAALYVLDVLFHGEGRLRRLKALEWSPVARNQEFLQEYSCQLRNEEDCGTGLTVKFQRMKLP